MPRIAALIALLLLAAAPAALGAGGRSITVDGTGTVSTVPNEADFNFGVAVTAPTAKGALSACARRTNSMIAALAKAGVKPSDIQTAEITLSPNTNENGTRIVNFTASNTVTVKTRAISKSGGIVDAAVAAGANTVDGPNLTTADQLALSQRALAAAVANARMKAQAIAAASHVRLGRVLTVTESSSTPITYAQVPKAAANASTPVEPGTVQTEEDVTVTFAIS
jgi:uncharacterized protein YggE